MEMVAVGGEGPQAAADERNLRVAERTFEIEFFDAGVRAYAFTFG
jgi:hypothetical protein